MPSRIGEAIKTENQVSITAKSDIRFLRVGSLQGTIGR
jgi:hypothetical protein